MKVLKLLVIFVLFVVAIIVAINWNSLFSSSSQSDFEVDNKLNISEECDKIRKGWEAVDEWDQNLYQQQRSDIDQSKSMKLFSEDGYNTVNNTLRETATNKACDAYSAEIAKTDADNRKLTKHYSGVIAIRDAENLSEDSRIKKVIGIHSIYCKIRDFASSNHTIVPKFNEESTDWVSFAVLQNSVLTTAKRYKNDSYYGSVKHISGFENALNEQKLMSQTNAQRASFYKELSRQIVAYFNDVEATQDNANLLNQIYKNFTTEESSNGVNELATCLVRLRNKIAK